MIKDPTNPILKQRSHTPSILILAQSKGPSIPAEPITREGVDDGVSIDFEIGELREAPEMNKQGEGTPAISALVQASTS